jgi:hypothetical protein
MASRSTDALAAAAAAGYDGASSANDVQAAFNALYEPAAAVSKPGYGDSEAYASGQPMQTTTAQKGTGNGTAANESSSKGQGQPAGSNCSCVEVGSRTPMMTSSEATGAAVLVSVLPKRESFTDGAAAVEPKNFQQLSSKQQQELYWKQQQQQQSPGMSPQPSPPQVSPSGSNRASRVPSRRSTGSVPMRSLEEWLEGDVNLADAMQQQQQQQQYGAARGGSVPATATQVQDSASLCLPVLQDAMAAPQWTAAAAASKTVPPATADGPAASQQQQQQQQQQQRTNVLVTPELPSNMSSAYGVISLQEIDYSEAGASQLSSARTSKDNMPSTSTSARHSSGSAVVSGGAAVYGRVAAAQAPAPATVSSDVCSWVAGLPDGCPAAIAMQECAERASAAQIDVVDALKYSLDLSSRCSGTDSCANSNATLPHVVVSGSATGAGPAARAIQLQAAGVSDAAGAEDANSKGSSGLQVTAIVLEQQEMLRRLKAFKGRLGSSGGAAPAQAMRHGGGRLSPSLSMASSFTACTGGRQDGLSCRSAGRENSSSAVASKWGTHYI